MPNVVPAIVIRLQGGRTSEELFRHMPKGTRLNARTLERIKECKDEYYHCNQKTLSGLARALRVEEAVLTGNKDLPDNLTHVPATKPVEHFETRLVKLDDKFVIVEFSRNHDTGRIIARDIEDEEAGKRLSRAGDLRKKFIEVFFMISNPMDFRQGFFEHLMNLNMGNDHSDEDDFDTHLDVYLDELAELLGVERPKSARILRLAGEEVSR